MSESAFDAPQAHQRPVKIHTRVCHARKATKFLFRGLVVQPEKRHAVYCHLVEASHSASYSLAEPTLKHFDMEA